MADYLAKSELQTLKKKQGLESIVRDFEFGKNWDKEDIKTEKAPREDTEAEQLPRKPSAIEELQLSVSTKPARYHSDLSNRA